MPTSRRTLNKDGVQWYISVKVALVIHFLFIWGFVYSWSENCQFQRTNLSILSLLWSFYSRFCNSRSNILRTYSANNEGNLFSQKKFSEKIQFDLLRRRPPNHLLSKRMKPQTTLRDFQMQR